MGMYSMIDDATDAAIFRLMKLGMSEADATEVIVEALRQAQDGPEPQEPTDGE